MPSQRCITVPQWRFVIKYHLVCQHSCNEYLLQSVFHSLLRLELQSLLVFVSLINFVNKLLKAWIGSGDIACKQALWGALAVGWEKEGELAAVSGIFNSTSNSPVAPCQLRGQISANQCKAETSTNVNKHWKIHAKVNDVITNVISTNQHFASTFSMQIFKF